MPLWSSKKSEQKRTSLFLPPTYTARAYVPKFVNAGKFYNVRTLILGGDITAKYCADYCPGAIGTSHSAGHASTLRDDGELADLRKKLENSASDCGVSEANTVNWSMTHRVDEIYREKAPSGWPPGFDWPRSGLRHRYPLLRNRWQRRPRKCSGFVPEAQDRWYL
jgi:hypothetical protein